jgi:polyisoprenoid-binding protein YceI
MVKYFFTILMLTGFCCHQAQAQKYFTRDGVITFTSKAPVENIESSNKEVNIIIDPAASTIAFKVVMKSFAFEKQGMKDHFNTDYLHTDKFPNATFEGKIISKVDWSFKATYNAAVEGTLTIHGVSKPIKQNGQIIVEDGKIKVSAAFNILLTDFKIAVPSNYISKISNTIRLQINGTLTPYQR